MVAWSKPVHHADSCSDFLVLRFPPNPGESQRAAQTIKLGSVCICWIDKVCWWQGCAPRPAKCRPCPAPRELAKPARWSGAKLNSIHMCRNNKKGIQVFRINICLTHKSLDADVYTSTEWTGGHQGHLLYLYLLMTTPNSQIHIRKPFVWVSVNLCAFPPPRGFSPLPCPAGLIALCISVCLFFNKLVFGSWKHSLLLDDSLWRLFTILIAEKRLWIWKFCNRHWDAPPLLLACGTFSTKPRGSVGAEESK